MRNRLSGLKKILFGTALAITSSLTANAYDFISGTYDENSGWTKDENGKGAKWKLNENGKRELKYKIDRNCSKEIEEIFLKSAKKWSDALDGRITFVPCKNSEKSEIFITTENLKSQTAARTYIVPSLEESLPNCYYLKSVKIILNSLKFPYIPNNDDRKPIRRDNDVSSSNESQDLSALFKEDVITHELGHLLGLDDIYDPSKINYPYNMQKDFPTMFFENRGFGIISTLHIDDVNGIRKRYELPEQPDRTLSDEIIVEQIKGKKYRLYVSSTEVDNHLVWNFKKRNSEAWKSGFETEITFGKDVRIQRKKGDKKNRYCFEVQLQWNGRTATYEIPLRTLRKEKRNTFSISPREE